MPRGPRSPSPLVVTRCLRLKVVTQLINRVLSTARRPSPAHRLQRRERSRAHRAEPVSVLKRALRTFVRPSVRSRRVGSCDLPGPNRGSPRAPRPLAPALAG